MAITQAHRAYQHVRGKLLAGDIKPGTRILYGPIGKELGISATPVREAMGQLAQEGLVELVPQLGAVVRQIDRRELVELYEMREAIEPYAAARAAERATPDQLAEITSKLQTMRRLTDQVTRSVSLVAGKRVTQQFEAADLAFHMLVIEATGNQTLVRTAGNSHVLSRVFGTPRHPYDASLMQQTCDDHEKILRAIELRDAALASAETLAHIRRGLDITLKNFDIQKDRWWSRS